MQLPGFHFSILCLSIVPVLCAPATMAQQPSTADSAVIRVLYYHGTIRCHTCLQIEEFTNLTMKNRFQDRILHGSILWRVVDYEKEHDTTAVRRYGIDNQALIISKMIGGEEIAWRKLNRIWELVEDFNAFQEYVVTNVEAMRDGKSLDDPYH